jgi:diaminohydroxyphosphoribosylaminopyrimidine deaminase/5-amino-6-(5-phosphoribosylamino)uracil reductase
MRRAIELAAGGRGRVEPNPLVGAVVVRDGNILGEGFHARFGGTHAEVAALTACRESPAGATVYVTLEPCCHVGKTPPCTDALIAAEVARVVFAVIDPFPRVAGGGRRALESAGVAVESGLLADDAVAANAPYFKLRATGRPYVIAKWAQTAAGELIAAGGSALRSEAAPPGDARAVSAGRRRISNEASRRRVHELRNRVDAILIGIGTALADDPLLTARIPGGRNPRRFVLDAACRLPADSYLVRTVREAPTTVVCAAADADLPGRRGSIAPPGPGRAVIGSAVERACALRSAGVEVLPLSATDGRIELGTLLDEMGRRGITNLLVEGGPTVLSAFFTAGLVDEVQVFAAPPSAVAAAAGDRPLGPPARLARPPYAGFPDPTEAAERSTAAIEELEGDRHLTARLTDPSVWRPR